VVRTSLNRWAHVGLGAALALGGDEPAAKQVWAEGTRIHRGNLTHEATYAYRVEVLMGQGKIEAAWALVGMVLAARPSRTPSACQRAELAWLRGEDAEGQAALRRGLSLCPGLLDQIRDPTVVAALLGDGTGSDGRIREAAIEECRTIRAAM